jgi:hypothetical protein
MYVYLIHFETPSKHAKHYLGFSDNLAARISEPLDVAGRTLSSKQHAQAEEDTER